MTPKERSMLQLLEHGPLSARDAIAITGWNAGTCRNVLHALASDGHVQREGERWGGTYRLADRARVRAFAAAEA